MGFVSRNCWRCDGKKSIQKFIRNNSLVCTCLNCNWRYAIDLIKIKKKIIYLDQNFFSNAYKRKDERFTKIADKLANLSKKQLIICPFSEMHDRETHLYKKRIELWDFIKKTSYGCCFKFKSQIEMQQLCDAYIAFCNSESDKHVLETTYALSPEIHQWIISPITQAHWSITNFISIENLRLSKNSLIEHLINAIDQWSNHSKRSLKEDFDFEITSYTKLLRFSYGLDETYEQHLENEMLRKLHMLLTINTNGKNEEEIFSRVNEFLISQHFKNTPYINISAGLFALIKQKVQIGQFSTNPEKIKNKVKGLANDIEHLSIFAPYCNAVFTDNEAADLFEKWCKHPLGNYKIKIFSLNTIDRFNDYLDEIENSMSTEMKEELEIIYE